MPRKPIVLNLLILSVMLLGACAPAAATEPAAQALPSLEAPATDLAPTFDALASSIAPTAQALPAQPSEVPSEAPEPSAAAPTAPQPEAPAEGKTYRYDDDISIFVPTSVADGASIVEIDEHEVGEDAFPDMSFPEHYLVSFEGYKHAEAFHTPAIYVWEIGDYEELNPGESGTVRRQVDALREILRGQELPAPANASAAYGKGLPFLPLWNAGPIFTAQIARVPFKDGDGIRYLTMYGQALNPISNFEVFYTYQGISRDGEEYVAAVLPIASGVLPDTPEAVADWEKFIGNYQSYLDELLVKLNADGEFAPSLAALDAMIGSLEVDD